MAMKRLLLITTLIYSCNSYNESKRITKIKDSLDQMASSHYYRGRTIRVDTVISNFPLPNYTTFRAYSFDSTKRLIYVSEKAHANSGTTEWAIVAHYLNDSIFKMDYTIYDTTYKSQSSWATIYYLKDTALQYGDSVLILKLKDRASYFQNELVNNLRKANN